MAKAYLDYAEIPTWPDRFWIRIYKTEGGRWHGHSGTVRYAEGLGWFGVTKKTNRQVGPFETRDEAARATIAGDIEDAAAAIDAAQRTYDELVRLAEDLDG